MRWRRPLRAWWLTGNLGLWRSDCAPRFRVPGAMNAPLFRAEVIEAKRDRLEGNVIAAVPPTSRVYTILVASVMAIMIAILIFGSYATSAQVRGIVAYDTGIARVYPAVPAEIRQIHVRYGQLVPAGAPLVTLALAQGADGLTGQLAQLNNQDSELGHQLDLASDIGGAEQRALTQQRDSLTAAVASLERQHAIAAGQIALA